MKQKSNTIALICITVMTCITQADTHASSLTTTAQPIKNATAPEKAKELVGADANKNGIRDDIETYIDAKPGTTPQKQSMRMVSKAMTAAMLSPAHDANALRDATTALNMAVACIWKSYPADVADNVVSEMRKVTVNTKARYDAYMNYSRLLSGSVIKLPRQVTCD
jgi:hypothetical protein